MTKRNKIDCSGWHVWEGFGRCVTITPSDWLNLYDNGRTLTDGATRPATIEDVRAYKRKEQDLWEQERRAMCGAGDRW